MDHEYEELIQEYEQSDIQPATGGEVIGQTQSARLQYGEIGPHMQSLAEAVKYLCLCPNGIQHAPRCDIFRTQKVEEVTLLSESENKKVQTKGKNRKDAQKNPKHCYLTSPSTLNT